MMRDRGALKIVRNAVTAVLAALTFLFAIFVFTACEDEKPPQQKPNEYAISITPSDNGMVTASAKKAKAGITVTLTVTPNEGYLLQSLTYNGNDITEAKSFVMPDEAVTVAAVFRAAEYNVTVDDCENGSVSVSAVKATVGTEITVTATPDANYRLVGITYGYGDKDYDITSECKFDMPAADVTVSAEFERVYAVAVDIEIEHGTVAVDKTEAAEGETVTLNVTPENEYALKSLKVNGVDIDISSAPYAFTMPGENVTVTATFSTAHTITVVADNGSLTVLEKATEGNTVAITANPDKGYELSALKYTDGQGDHEIDISRALSFIMPDEDVTVTATFTAITYNVTVTTPVNGSVTASANSGVIGDEITLTVTADTGYELKTLTANGADIKADKKFTIDDEDVTVVATFGLIDYSISVADGITGGSVVLGVSIANMGDTVSFTVTPDSGYGATAIKYSYTDDGETVDVYLYDGRTFTLPASDVTVSVVFKPIIKITSAEGFAAIANDLGGYYVLDKNLSLDGAMSPIGTAPLAAASGYTDERAYVFDKSGTVQQGEAFTGVFDGQGYIIIGYTQNGTAHAPENYYHGIFGYIGEGACVGNFTLREATVNGGKLGALISGVNLGKIENVVVESDSRVHIFYSLVGCAAAYNGGTINNVVCYIEKGTSNYGDTAFTAQNLVYESAEGASANNLYVLPNDDVSDVLGDGWFYHELVGTVYGNDSYTKYISSSATATAGEAFDITVYRKNPDNGELSFYVWSGLNIGNPFVYVGYDAETHTYHEMLNTAHDFVTKESINFGINIGGYICSARTIAIAPHITSVGFGDPKSADDAYTGTTTNKFINLVDGDPNSGVAFNTNGLDGGIYIEVDLVNAVEIEKLRVVLGRTSKSGEFVNGFAGHVEIVGADGTTALDLGTFGNAEHDFVSVLLPSEIFEVRYIRIYMDSAHSGWSALSELYINDLAGYDKPVVKTDNFGNLYSNTVYANMFDGDDGTYAWFTRPAEAGGHLRIDLLEVKQISVMRFKIGKPEGGDSVNGHVEYSEDGVSYTSLGKFNETDSIFNAAAFDARFIRIVVDNAASYMAIREVYINEQVDLTDRALPIITSNGFGDAYQGSFDNLFDGDDTTMCWFNKTPSADSYILIDLLDSVSLEALRIVNGKANNGGDRIKGIVEISADGENFIQIGELNGDDVEINIVLDSVQTARCIRIKNNGSGGWTALCEITVNPAA